MFRDSIAPVTADHVGELTMVELQARLIAAAEGNSLRDAIIRSQSIRISELTDQLSRAKRLTAIAAPVKSTVREVADRSPAPIRVAAYGGARVLRDGRRALLRLLGRAR